MAKSKRNTAPSAWTTQAPQTPYPCNAKYIGQVVPGADGGQITACATPSAERPKEGQYWIGDPQGKGRPIRKRHVTHRLYEKTKRGKHKTPPEQVEQAAHYNEQLHAIPTPTGDERPHHWDKSPCSPGAPPWNTDEYKEAVKTAIETAQERYALETEGEVLETSPSEDVPFAANPSRLDELIYEEFSKHPKAKEWEAQALACSAAFYKRKKATKARPTKEQKRLKKAEKKRAETKAKKEETSRKRRVAKALRSARNNKLLPANQPAVEMPDAVAVIRLSQREFRRWNWGDDVLKNRVRELAGQLSYKYKGPVYIMSYHQQPVERIIASARGMQ